jgi:chitodextrinase
LVWKSGTYTGGDAASNNAWGNWRGRPIDVINTFTTRDQGWGELEQPDWVLDAMNGFKGQLVISQPMWPEGQGNSAQCAQGAYDTHWKAFGSWLVQKGRANSIVRLGWEGNGDFMYWSATSADLSNGNWKTCWNKVAKAIKSTNPQVVMDWTVNAHGSDTIDNHQAYDPYASNSPVYPGDDVVDVVGIDSYDMYPPSQTAFAKAHGKKFSVGEWGTVTCGGNPGGDNTTYVQKMFDTFKANQSILAYEAYFDYTDEVCSGYYPTNQAPKASALYKQLWGVNSSAAEGSTPVTAGCTTPTNYGTVTKTISVPTSGTYKIWSRIMAPDTTNNSYSLDIDNSSCVVVGDSAATPANTWTWVGYKGGSTTTPITVSLSAGTHTLKIVGRESGVKVDRLMALADQACVPSGTGNNCTATADATAPVVTITAPANGSTVQATTAVSATATDATGVTKVEFYIDNQLQSTASITPYTYQWNTGGLTNGTHSVVVKAYDAAGNVGAVTSSVTVANGDTQAPSVPLSVVATANATNKVTVTWAASTDNVGIHHYLLTRNGAVLTTVTSGTSYTDTTVLPSTLYSYQVTAYDAAGNKSNPSAAATATTPTPTVQDTQAPSVPTGVLATPVSTSQINLTWTASTDDVGVASYDVYRAAPSSLPAKVTTVTGRQYGDSGLTSNTAYTYYVIAKDAAGNQSAQSVQVTATTQAPSQTVSTGTLRGVVTGNGGKVLNGVTVILWSSEGKQYTGTTNASGVYRFSNLPEGPYAANYHVAGYRDKQVYPYIVAGDDTTRNIQLSTRVARPWWQRWWW